MADNWDDLIEDARRVPYQNIVTQLQLQRAAAAQLKREEALQRIAKRRRRLERDAEEARGRIAKRQRRLERDAEDRRAALEKRLAREGQKQKVWIRPVERTAESATDIPVELPAPVTEVETIDDQPLPLMSDDLQRREQFHLRQAPWNLRKSRRYEGFVRRG